MERRRLYFAALADVSVGANVALDERSRKHAQKVLRLTPGSPVLLFDGEGREAPATLVEGGSCRIDDIRARPLPGPVLHLVLALPKGPAADDAVRMATELGVSSIHLAITRRSVAKETKEARLARWERIALEAVRQCERPTTPRIHPPAPLHEVIARPAPSDALFFAWARSDHPAAPSLPGPRWVAIGPEGGFADEEVASLRSAGFVEISLAPTILRVATAVAAAATLLRQPS